MLFSSTFYSSKSPEKMYCIRCIKNVSKKMINCFFKLLQKIYIKKKYCYLELSLENPVKSIVLNVSNIKTVSKKFNNHFQHC